MDRGFVLRIALAAGACAAAYAQTSDSGLKFEVASVKPAVRPASGGITMSVNNDPGRITLTNMSLSNLIAIAYDLNSYRLDAPDWTQRELFTVAAKLPEGSTRAQMPEMMRNLLVERFKLAVHHEQRAAAASTLVVARGGLKVKESTGEAAAQSREAGPRSSGPKLDADGYPVLNGPGMSMTNGRARMWLEKITMAQLAARLSGQLRQTVTDGTGLTGKYDIILSWSTAATRARTDGSVVEVDDPAPDLFQALEQQLGLKLETRKTTVDIVVVDHVERVPAEN